MLSAAATSGGSGSAAEDAGDRQEQGAPHGPRGRSAVAGTGSPSGPPPALTSRRPRRPPARTGAPGPGSGRPSSIARGPCLEVGGLGRVVGPDGLEAVPLGRGGPDRGLEVVGDALRGALEVRRVRGRHREVAVALDAEPAGRRAPDGHRRDERARLGGQRGGPGRERRPGPEQPDRDPVAVVAPVHEQRQDLLAAEHGEQLAQVAPRDDVHAPRLPLRAQELEDLGERGVVGDDVGGVAAPRDGGGDGLVVADMARRPRSSGARRPSHSPAIRSTPSPSIPLTSSSSGRDGSRISSTMYRAYSP